MVDLFSTPGLAAVQLPIALLVGYGILRIMTIAFAELRDAVFAKVGQRAIRAVALSTFQHLHKLSLRFHLDRQTGGLSRSIERGTKGIDFLLTFMLFNILPTLLEITLVCGVLWYMFNVWFAVVTFGTIVSYITYTLLVTEWRLKYRRQMNETDQQASTRAKRYEKAAVTSKTTLALLNIGQAAIVGIGLTIVMAMAGQGVIDGSMTTGDFVLVNTYLIQLYMPLNFLGFVYREIKQSLTDMESMFALLDLNEEVKDAEDAAELSPGPGEVVFKNVSFAYDKRRPILNDFSIEVPAGKKLAIVGASGAGKSTLSRLLFRFYDIDEGAILIDGDDIRNVTQKSVREAIGIVPQDTVLFNDTIYYNILYGKPDATREAVENAARLARIEDFILQSPDGYETMVGERGLKLSGGEKQRVAIARTILKDPRILLFDEATSALDTNTEREIQQSLKEVSTGKTTLVIAHRLSTVIDADEILVLQNGRVTERGQHDELLAQEGHYSEMWLKQQRNSDHEELLLGDT